MGVRGCEDLMNQVDIRAMSDVRARPDVVAAAAGR